MRVKEHSTYHRLFNLDKSKKATKTTLALSQDYSTWMRVHIHSPCPKMIDSDESKKATKPTLTLLDSKHSKSQIQQGTTIHAKSKIDYSD
jgi:hypothetical protein